MGSFVLRMRRLVAWGTTSWVLRTTPPSLYSNLSRGITSDASGFGRRSSTARSSHAAETREVIME
jgi:hypothetical protein